MVVERPITCTDPDLSVVIPTIPSNTIYALSSLEEQTYERFECIIVKDENINRLEARNQGLKEAEGDIIAQTDDDCKPPLNWIKSIINVFQDSEYVLIEGGVDKHNPGPRHYIGANLAYRKTAALEIGGFDPFYAGWRGDTEFGWRMEDKYGVGRCYYDRSLEVYHVGPLRSNINLVIEKVFQDEYPERYKRVLNGPPGILQLVKHQYE